MPAPRRGPSEGEGEGALHKLVAAVVCALAIALALPGVAAARDKEQLGTTVIHPTEHDVSPPLASIPPQSESVDPKKPKKEKELRGFPQVTAGAIDTAVQSSVAAAAAPATLTSFDGIGQGFVGPAGTFTVQYAPPDTNGAVGPNHFVQIVNVSFAVFSKTGTPLYGPAAINTLWSGFGGLCERDNDGDPTAVYDQLADRWVIQQFAVSGANGSSVPYLECIAVSTSGDPTGTYNRYSYQSSKFPDYPKLGIWPDAYYLTTNDFNANNSFAGASAWAFDRAKMLAGDPSASGQVVHLGSQYGGLLPSSLDGKTPPPVGSPDYFVALATSTSLFFWKFHVDFANMANSTFTGPTSLPVAGFTELCNGGTCVPQAGTTQRLDSLADRLMYRLAYRNFGDHEALVVTHSVAPSTGGGGIRWYEIRSPSGTPSVYQQSTYAPDTRYRWMASAAMDGVGNIGVGYSLSSSTMNPAIAYTGRLASDPLNTLQAETVLVQGTGSQTATLSRWGDYSSMSVDPTDDCTFWYTTEYLTANGTWNWHTRIGTFKFANCPATPAPTVTGVSPSSGPTAGGTAIAISGTGFAAGATVTVGGTPATGVSVVSATQINATTPAHAAGVADVVVTVGGQSSAINAADRFTYVAPPPTVSGVSPSSGTTLGGTAITITGTSFAAGATVTIGGTAASGVSVVSATQISATTLAHAAGVADVIVTVGGQSSAANPADQFTYVVPPPTVSGVSPTSGLTDGGTAITITGTNFDATATVTVGGTAATGVAVVSATQINATTPAHAAGVADVIVTVGGQASAANAADQFTYLAPPPTVSGVSPASGPTAGGTAITITGTNFDATATVTVGGTAATSVAFVSATQINATTPAHAAGVADVVVTVGGQSSATSAADQFTYVAPPPPTVTGVSPASGPSAGGTAITITGTNFDATATVTVGGAAATGVSIVSATQINATTPAHTAGTVDVIVTVGGQSSAANPGDQFTYIAPPTISAVSPTSGPFAGGTAITITGTGFDATATVTVGGTLATGVTVVSATQINATTPAHAAGVADVIVTVNGQSSVTSPADQFTYVAPPPPAPTVTGVSPTSGPIAGGTAITITGTNFDASATVTVGGTPATSVSVVSATQINATTPAHVAGTFDVIVTVGGQSSATSAADQFMYIAPPPPTVTGVSPTSGPTSGGTAITISGTNFDATATVTVGGAVATGVSFVSATQLSATTPAHVAGAADVVVTVGGQSSATSAADQFTYVAPPAPTVTGVSPTSGSTAGGIAITISGTNFDTTATVTVGGTAATGVSFVNATQINATTPAHAAGIADVIVTVAGQPSATSPSDQFTYIAPPPTVSAVSPSLGPTVGGTAITITGTGFDATATVTVGGTAATGVTVVSATQINATTPAHAVGAADVVVTVGGQSSAMNPGDQFTYVAPPAPLSVSPATGSTFGGTNVTITGTDFRTGATVTFGGTALTSVTVVNTTTITGTTASHAAGAVDVVVRNPDGQAGTCAGCYSYAASPPVISNVQSSVSPNRKNATITWTTDIPADSQVEYGTSTAYGSFSALNSTLVTGHSVTLTGLSRGTTYHYRIYSRNSLGELTVSGDFTVTTS